MHLDHESTADVVLVAVVTIALIQVTITWRHASGLDLAADAVGVAIGSMVWSAWTTQACRRE